MLVAYVDGEADASLIPAIEAHLEASEQARKTVEAIKKTNMILAKAANETLNKSRPEPIQAIIEAKRLEEQKQSEKVLNGGKTMGWTQSIKTMLGSFTPSVPQVAMVAASLVVGVYIGINNQQLDSGLDLNYETKNFDLILTRGAESGSDLMAILKTILEERRQTATITQNKEQYIVKLLENFQSSDREKCDVGEITKPTGETAFFLGCLDSDGTWNIEFTNPE
ncbi:uncharacterized protein METZ01_LOCUS262937 [marine metagenome]|uniref:Uncharacterized protein n=1 Tax=marine metagenome TaxID=408172 RepID=A0A382JG00_9ZZZZ